MKVKSILSSAIALAMAAGMFTGMNITNVYGSDAGNTLYSNSSYVTSGSGDYMKVNLDKLFMTGETYTISWNMKANTLGSWPLNVDVDGSKHSTLQYNNNNFGLILFYGANDTDALNYMGMSIYVANLFNPYNAAFKSDGVDMKLTWDTSVGRVRVDTKVGAYSHYFYWNPGVVSQTETYGNLKIGSRDNAVTVTNLKITSDTHEQVYSEDFNSTSVIDTARWTVNGTASVTGNELVTASGSGNYVRFKPEMSNTGKYMFDMDVKAEDLGGGWDTGLTVAVCGKNQTPAGSNYTPMRNIMLWNNLAWVNAVSGVPYQTSSGTISANTTYHLNIVWDAYNKEMTTKLFNSSGALLKGAKTSITSMSTVRPETLLFYGNGAGHIDNFTYSKVDTPLPHQYYSEDFNGTSAIDTAWWTVNGTASVTGNELVTASGKNNYVRFKPHMLSTGKYIFDMDISTESLGGGWDTGLTVAVCGANEAPTSNNYSVVRNVMLWGSGYYWINAVSGDTNQQSGISANTKYHLNIIYDADNKYVSTILSNTDGSLIASQTRTVSINAETLLFYGDGAGHIDNFKYYSTESFIFTATVSDDGNGSASVSQSGNTATFTATADTGYNFDGWYNGQTKVSSANPYETTLSADTALTAKFTAKDAEAVTATTAVSGMNDDGTTYKVGVEFAEALDPSDYTYILFKAGDDVKGGTVENVLGSISGDAKIAIILNNSPSRDVAVRFTNEAVTFVNAE